jgi:hypothetical protein
MLKILRTYQRLIATDLRPEIYAKVAFENVSEAISQYLSGVA